MCHCFCIPTLSVSLSLSVALSLSLFLPFYQSFVVKVAKLRRHILDSASAKEIKSSITQEKTNEELLLPNVSVEIF